MFKGELTGEKAKKIGGNGSETVAVKVIHPHVEQMLRTDMDLLSYVMRIDILSGLVLYNAVAYSISSGTLGSPDLLLSNFMILLSNFMIAFALHNTTILIITHKSFNPKPTDQLIQIPC